MLKATVTAFPCSGRRWGGPAAGAAQQEWGTLAPLPALPGMPACCGTAAAQTARENSYQTVTRRESPQEHAGHPLPPCSPREPLSRHGCGSAPVSHLEAESSRLDRPHVALVSNITSCCGTGQVMKSHKNYLFTGNARQKGLAHSTELHRTTAGCHQG